MSLERLSRSARHHLAVLARALRDFGRGFVGETRIPRERHAACSALEDRANGRGRCC